MQWKITWQLNNAYDLLCDKFLIYLNKIEVLNIEMAETQNNPTLKGRFLNLEV